MDNKQISKQKMLDTLKFLTPLNRIILYYETVFNIKVKNVFYKKKEFQELIQNSAIDLRIYNELIKIPIIISIKDNNKKFLKTRILKFYMHKLELNLKTNKIFEGEEIIANLIDENLSKYCLKKYFNKNNDSNLNNIYDKNEKINYEYQNWIKQNK